MAMEGSAECSLMMNGLNNFMAIQHCDGHLPTQERQNTKSDMRHKYRVDCQPGDFRWPLQCFSGFSVCLFALCRGEVDAGDFTVMFSSAMPNMYVHGQHDIAYMQQCNCYVMLL